MEKRNGNKQENEVGWMNFLTKIKDRLGKEINTDWRIVALDLNRELIEAREENRILYQRISDLEKLLEV